jgi:hypothetical protein
MSVHGVSAHVNIVQTPLVTHRTCRATAVLGSNTTGKLNAANALINTVRLQSLLMSLLEA